MSISFLSIQFHQRATKSQAISQVPSVPFLLIRTWRRKWPGCPHHCTLFPRLLNVKNYSKCKVMDVLTSQHIICCADEIVSENHTVVCNYPRSYAQNRNIEGFRGSMAVDKAVAWDGYPGQTRPQNARPCTASYLSPTQRCPFNFSKT